MFLNHNYLLRMRELTKLIKLLKEKKRGSNPRDDKKDRVGFVTSKDSTPRNRFWKDIEAKGAIFTFWRVEN